MSKDTGYFFKCLLTICIPSWEKCLFKPLPISKLGYLSFLLLSCKCPLYILDTSPLSDIWFASIFSHSVGFHFLDGVLWSTNGLNFWWSLIYFISFVVCASDVVSKKALPNMVIRIYFYIFFWKFYSIPLKFSSMIHFQSNFLYGRD